MNRSRVTAGPLGFVLAVLAAVIIFYISMTEGLTMALGVALMVAALFYAFNSDGGGVYALVLAALAEGIYKSVTANMITMLVKDIFLGILLLRLLWVSQRRRDFTWVRQPFTAFAICFAAYCVALMFTPSTRSLLLALAGFRVWILWMPVYFPFYHFFTDLGRIRRFLTFIILLMLPVSLYGIVQGNIGYEHMRVLPNFYKISQFYQSDYHPEQDQNPGEGAAGFEAEFKPIMNVRACSIHISPGTFGAMCAILVLLSIGYVGYARTNRMRMVAILSGLAAAGGLLASGSRAPLMGLAAGLLAMLFVARRRGALIGGIILVSLVSVFLLRDMVGGGAIRLQKRLSLAGTLKRAWRPMERGMDVALKHPFGNGIASGTGMGRMFYGAGLQTAEGTEWLENEFARGLGELGFFGSILWLFMICSILWHCSDAVRRMGHTREGILGAALFGGMMSVFAQLSVGSALYGAHGGIYYWVFAAAIMRMAEFVEARERARAEAQPKPALAPTGTFGVPDSTSGGLARAHRPSARRAPPPPAFGPPQPGAYRRAPGAPPGPRPGAVDLRRDSATDNSTQDSDAETD